MRKSELQPIEQWNIFELVLTGPADGTSSSDGNPFIEVELSAESQQADRSVMFDGFYDGEGVYRIRFMPAAVGAWTDRTHSNRAELDARTGEFMCIAAGEGNHGPVRVRNTFHFAYADGTLYLPFGTTCYAWTHQGDALEEQTLATLAHAPFNKLRMCVFPKHYIYNKNEPLYYPFARDASGRHDTTRFNPEFFRHEADIIDTWEMTITPAPLVEPPASPPVRGVATTSKRARVKMY